MNFKDRCIIVLAGELTRILYEQPKDPVGSAIDYVRELDRRVEAIDKEKAE